MAARARSAAGPYCRAPGRRAREVLRLVYGNPERITPLEFAMAEARELNHSYVGTEHLLLGLLREEKGIAAEVLTQLGVSLDDARRETLKLLGSEPSAAPSPGTPTASAQAMPMTRR